MGHANCGKALRESELNVHCTGIVAKDPAIHERCKSCWARLDGWEEVPLEGKTRDGVTDPTDKGMCGASQVRLSAHMPDMDPSEVTLA